MKNTEKKAKNTDWILKQLSEEGKKIKKSNRRKKEKTKIKERTPVLEVLLKNIRIKNVLFKDRGISMSRISLLKQCCDANITFIFIYFLFFSNGKNEKI